MKSPRSAFGLAAFLAGAGVTHFARPRPYDTIIPSWLPGRPRTWTYASGVLELACATAIALPRTRRAGALAAAGLFVGVFPANVKMAYDWRRRPLPYRVAAYARLPLQAPLVAWGLTVARSAQGIVSSDSTNKERGAAVSRLRGDK
ncbi:DoxX family protein [Actinomadura sp. DC4]|uniref:DoxX family protein n=1 Tax=Actinomadura sp. DC4 TaxID=3055069 RepID=UPI0025B135D4|nr:DoxX family protein [Actinomadura sp. DC4]MDN3359241.1 DoxX family protein [Actinomadura sp. DC4]